MKIALIGYGKMGKEIEKIALSRGHEIVSIIDVNNQEDFNSDAFKSADVAIEFTNPMAAYSNYIKTFEAGVKLVSGSTGWMDEHGDEIKELCTKGGKTLFPKNDWLTEAHLAEHEKIFMTEYLANDDRRKVYHRYRLRTCDPTRFTETLEYDLKCPHCNGDLRLCGLPLDATTHGLYKCRRCDEATERR